MANWDKLNKEFYDRLNDMTDIEWNNWYNNLKIKRSMKTQEQCRMTKDVVKTTYIPNKQTALSVDILIPKNTNVEINYAGSKKEFMCDSVEILIGIGKDYTAYLTMDIEAFEALQIGELITILPFAEE